MKERCNTIRRTHPRNSIVIFFMVMCALTGCAASDAKPDSPYRAQVLHFEPSGRNSAAQWNVSEQTLPTLEDPDSLRGSDFEILTGQRLIVDSTVGSLIRGKVTGSANKNPIRYSVKNGVIVPRDTTTLLLFSAFHAFEQVLSQVEPVTGVKLNEFKSAVGSRYQILFEPTIDSSESGLSARLSLKMNAGFQSESNNFILFRRSGLERIPLAANVKVLSHEFGHALFKKSFYSQTDENCPNDDIAGVEKRRTDKFFKGRFSTEYAISGFNEGFADFNSFVMTGETNPLEGSFSEIDISRRSLVGEKFTFSQLSSNDTCNGRFYCIGTLFARALHSIASKYELRSEELGNFSRRIYSALGSTIQHLKEQPSLNLLPNPSQQIASCLRRDSIDLTYDGSVSAAFLSAFLKGLPAGTDKDLLCEQFITLFGQIGFPEDARSVCKS